MFHDDEYARYRRSVEAESAKPVPPAAHPGGAHPRSLIGYFLVWMGVLTAANLIVVVLYTVVARLFGGTAPHGP